MMALPGVEKSDDICIRLDNVTDGHTDGRGRTGKATSRCGYYRMLTRG